MYILGACDLTREVLLYDSFECNKSDVWENDYDYFVFIMNVPSKSVLEVITGIGEGHVSDDNLLFCHKNCCTFI